MSRDSLANAKAELFGLLSNNGVPTVAGVKTVYPYEPPAGGLAKPVSITVATDGMDAEHYLLAVRVYHTVDVDVHDAQDNLDALIMAVESKLTDGYPRSQWSVHFVEELAALVAVCQLRVGREDYL